MNQIACLHCDLLINKIELKQDEHAICPRCQQTIYLAQNAFTQVIALLWTAIFIYFPAVTLPFLSMNTSGQSQQVSLLSSVINIAHGNLLLLAITVFSLVILFPLLRLTGLLLITLPLARDELPFLGGVGVRWLLHASPWSMVEVYLVGVLVTLVKLTGIASIEFSSGFYAFILLIIINALISVKLPHRRIWQQIAHLKKL